MSRFKLNSMLLVFALILLENVSTIHNSEEQIKTGHYQREPYITESLKNQHRHQHQHHSYQHQHGSELNSDASLNYQQGPEGYQNVELLNTNYQGQSLSHKTAKRNTFAKYYTKCPSGYSGVLPYANDCYKFLNCWRGRSFIQVCSPGTALNPDTLQCDNKEKVSCTGGENSDPRQQIYRSQEIEDPPISQTRTGRLQSEPNYTPHGQEELSCANRASGLSPHPTDCSKFLNCANGRMFIQNCGPNTMFSATMLVCDFPHKVNCGTRPIMGLDETSTNVDKNDFSSPTEDKTWEDGNGQINYGQPTNVQYDYNIRDSKTFSKGNRRNQLSPDQPDYGQGTFHHSTSHDDHSDGHHLNHGHGQGHSHSNHHHHHHHQNTPNQPSSAYVPPHMPPQGQPRSPQPNHGHGPIRTPLPPPPPPPFSSSKNYDENVYHDRWTQMNMNRPKAPQSPVRYDGQFLPDSSQTRPFNENQRTPQDTQHAIQPVWEDSSSTNKQTWVSHDVVQPTVTHTVVEGKVDYSPTNIYGNSPPNITTKTNTIYYAQPVDDSENSDEYFRSSPPVNNPYRPTTNNRNSTTIFIDRESFPLPDDGGQINIPLGYPSTKSQPQPWDVPAPKRPIQPTPSSNQPYYPKQPTQSLTPPNVYYPQPPTKQFVPTPTKIPIDNVNSNTNVRVFQVFPPIENASFQIFPDPVYSKTYSGVAHSRNITREPSLFNDNQPSFDPTTKKQPSNVNVGFRGPFPNYINSEPEVIFSRDGIDVKDLEIDESKRVPEYRKPPLYFNPSEQTFISSTDRNSRSNIPPHYNQQYHSQTTPSSALTEYDDDKATTNLPIGDAFRLLLGPYSQKSGQITEDVANKAETHIMSLVKKKKNAKPAPSPPSTVLEPPSLPLPPPKKMSPSFSFPSPSSFPYLLIPSSSTTKPFEQIEKEVEFIFTGEQDSLSENNGPSPIIQHNNHSKQQNNWPLNNRNKHNLEFHRTHPNLHNPFDNTPSYNSNQDFEMKSTILKPLISHPPESITLPSVQLPNSQKINDDLSQKIVPSKFDDNNSLCEFDCGNGKCIKQFEVCDGIRNCGNRKDEQQCDHLGYEIRLSNEDGSHNKGRLEVKILGKWGYVCDDKFGMRDANVVCHELGFKLGAKEVKGNSFYPPSADMLDEWNQVSFVMDEIDCIGNETSLKDCIFDGWGVHDCTPNEIVGVECKAQTMHCPSDLWLCATSKECIPYDFVCDNTNDCSDQSDESNAICNSPIEYRLMDGGTEQEGRVEVKYGGEWGTVCDDKFTEIEAKVVCRSIGYDGPARIVKNAFGPGSGPIWLNQVSCLHGNETSIDKCSHWKWGTHNCNHTEDVSLKCSSGQTKQKKRSQTPKTLKWTEQDDIEDTFPYDMERSSKIVQKEFKCGQFNPNLIDEFESVEEGLVGNNNSAKRGYHPWQAAIRSRGHGGLSAHKCGAVLISNKHLLTAAHCLVGFPKGGFFIRMGDHYSNIDESSEIDVSIEDWYIHKEFRKGTVMNNDIALIVIKDAVRFSDYIQPICLPDKKATLPHGKKCKFSGWGSTKSGDSKTSSKLKSVDIPIITDAVCRQPHVHNNAITENMFCAGFLNEGADACSGDSGGPLICTESGGETLYGVISWGIECGLANKPGVYVKVSQYIDWIHENIRKSQTNRN